MVDEMFSIIIIIWLSGLTYWLIRHTRKFSKFSELEGKIKYLLPFVQDKTLKALTSYIYNDKNSSLEFDENGDLLEKSKENLENSKYFNKEFTPIIDIIKCKTIKEAIDTKLVHKLAKYRDSIIRQKIYTDSNKVSLFWQPGTIFSQDFGGEKQIHLLLENKNPLILFNSKNPEKKGCHTAISFEEFGSGRKIELLVLPEEYLT